MSGPIFSQGSIDALSVCHDWIIDARTVTRKTAWGAVEAVQKYRGSCPCGFKTGWCADRDRLMVRMVRHAFPRNLSLPGV